MRHLAPCVERPADACRIKIACLWVRATPSPATTCLEPLAFDGNNHLIQLCRSEAQIQEYFLPKSQREQAKRRRRGGGQQQQKREAAADQSGAAPEEAVALNSISE